MENIDQSINSEPTTLFEEQDRSTILQDRSTILVVDDEQIILNIIQLSLEEDGYDLLTAINAKEAREVYRQNSDKIGLVIIDKNLDDEDGLNLWCDLEQLGGPVPAIFMSGDPGFGEEIRSISGNTADFMSKPFRPLELSLRVKSQLGNA